jgi:hypothetical protein
MQTTEMDKQILSCKHDWTNAQSQFLASQAWAIAQKKFHHHKHGQ